LTSLVKIGRQNPQWILELYRYPLLLQLLRDDADGHDYIKLRQELREVVRSAMTPNACDCLSRQTRMTVSTVLQRGLERRTNTRDLMDGEEDIVRNLDGLYVAAKSVSVSVNVHVGVIVIVLVTVTVMIRYCVIRNIVRICVKLYFPVVVTVMSLNLNVATREWRLTLIDYGCTVSIFVDRCLFQDYVEIRAPIKTAGGTMYAVGKGTVGHIQNCLHVPTMDVYTLSISLSNI
jgi:hypothetical protein